MKFLAILCMASAHSFIFLNRLRPDIFSPAKSGDGWFEIFFYFMGIGSLLIPALAGMQLYVTTERFIVNGKLSNFNNKALVRSSLLLMAIESIKNAAIFGLTSFYKWDVLHFIGLSFLIMLIVFKRFQLKYLTIIVLFSLALSTVLAHFKDVIIESLSEWGMFILSHLGEISIAAVVLLMLVVFFLGKKLLEGQGKIKIGVLAISLMVLGVLTYFKLTTSELFFVQVMTLPMSILFQVGQRGGHIWPLIPWIAIVASGYLLEYYWKNLSKRNKKWFMISGFLSIVTFCTFFLSEYKLLFLNQFFFSSLFFIPNVKLVTLLILSLVFFNELFEMIARRIKNIAKPIEEMSDGILIVYVVHLFLIYNLSAGAVKLMPTKELLWAFPFVILFISYCLLDGYNQFFHKLIEIKFRKKE